jgi:hypothetical protein
MTHSCLQHWKGEDARAKCKNHLWFFSFFIFSLLPTTPHFARLKMVRQSLSVVTNSWPNFSKSSTQRLSIWVKASAVLKRGQEPSLFLLLPLWLDRLPIHMVFINLKFSKFSETGGNRTFFKYKFSLPISFWSPPANLQNGRLRITYCLTLTFWK